LRPVSRAGCRARLLWTDDLRSGLLAGPSAGRGRCSLHQCLLLPVHRRLRGGLGYSWFQWEADVPDPQTPSVANDRPDLADPARRSGPARLAGLDAGGLGGRVWPFATDQQDGRPGPLAAVLHCGAGWWRSETWGGGGGVRQAGGLSERG